MMKNKLIAFALLAAVGPAAHGYNSRIVYIGTDPGYHYGSFPEAVTLARNAVTWAGGSGSPNIAYVEEDSGFGGSVAGLLSAAGLSGTAIPAGSLASTSLSGYDVLFIGATTSAGGSGLSSAATNVQNFVNAGGGLVTEAEIFDSASWSWLPDAGLIGHSGSINVGTEPVSITDGSHPVMAGLSGAGLSGWGYSVHSNFATPGAAGFVELARDDTSGLAYIIARDVPAPGTGLLALAGLAAARRRRA